MTIKTEFRPSKSNPSKGTVWVDFYVSRERVHFSTKVIVELKHWNANQSKVKSSDPLASDKNLIIDNILSRINDVFVKYRLKDKHLSKNSFLRSYHRPTDYATFFDYVFAQFRKYDKLMASGTYFTHKQVITKLSTYRPQLSFDDIDKAFLDDYFVYLRNDLRNNENTAFKNMAVLKKYVRMAFKDGYIDENPFDGWKIKKGTASCVYLTDEELTTLVNLYQSGELEFKYHKTLEFFLFLCFSSLHVGDARTLTLEQFSSTTFTYFRKKLRTSKPEPIVVPISQPLRNLIINIAGTRRKGLLFDNEFSDQAMNRFLKVIAKISGINKTLTHKVGRHTFATIYLRKTKDISSLREILGHSDISETLIYAHVLDESKIEGVQCFNTFSIDSPAEKIVTNSDS